MSESSNAGKSRSGTTGTSGSQSEPDQGPDTPCPITGFTRAEKKILVNSWDKMIGNTEEDFKLAGINLLLWMFDNIPNMRSLFPFGKKADDILKRDEVFLGHTQRVILSVDTCIRALDEPETLVAMVKKIAESHVTKKPPVTPAYFLAFRDNFHLFLNIAIDVNEKSDEARLWKALLGIIADLVVAADNALPKDQKKKGCCEII